MKKTFLTFCFISACIFTLKGQTDHEKSSSLVNRKDNVNISIGIGAGNFTQLFLEELVNVSNASNAKFTAAGPFFGKLEYMLENRIGLGISYAYLNNNVNYLREINRGNSNYFVNADLKRATSSILLRFNYHFSDSKKIDPYAGIGFGYRTSKWTYSDNDPLDINNQNGDTYDLRTNLFPLGADLTLGMRYMPHPNIGVYFEAGIAKGIIQGGLTASF